ncbi:hypothetical protein AKJ51_03730, partial [candidate division MSBL1 archaeon SCGC-AAA382A20]
LEQAEALLEREDDRLNVETATSADEALELLEENNYGAIVADQKMPERSGLKMLETLRGRGDETPFIVLTGKGGEETAMEAVNLDADSYFRKDENPGELYSNLAEAIVRKAEERESQRRLERARRSVEKKFERPSKGGEKFEELIDEAVKVEEKADEAFKNTIQEFDDPKLEGLLLSLRIDGVVHLKVLETLKGLFKEKREAMGKVRGKFSGSSISHEDAVKIIESIISHIETEKDQKSRLRRMIDLEPGRPIKEKLRWILREEERHHDLLEELAREI